MPLPTYLMSNFPSVRPSLNLQFDSQPTPEDMTSHLASVGATFSRASIGTYTDANGLIQEASAGQARPNYSSAGVHEGLLIEESRTNLVKSSQDFTANSYNNKLNIIVERHANVSTPIEGVVADKIIADTTSGGHYIGQGIAVTSGTDYTHSVIVKADGESNLRLVFASAQFGSKALVLDLDDVENPIADTVDSKTIEDLGDGWYRISVTAECTTSGTANFSVGLGSTFSFAGNGTDGMFAVANQVEAGSFPTSYIPTIPTFSSRASTATYFDSSGVLQTASIDEARTDHKYIDGQWVEAGLLLEGASTNEQAYSEDLDNFSGYDFVGSSVAESSITTPANDTNSYLFTESGASGHYIVTDSNFRPSISSGETWTISIFAKKGDGANAPDIIQLTHSSGSFGGGQYANFNISTGVVTDSSGGTARIEDVSNGWYRCSWTATATGSATGVLVVALTNNNPTSTRLPSYTASSDSDVYLWGAQLEAQSQATSYIKTTTASATRSADVYTTATKTRSADVCYIDGTAFTDFYNQEQGTWFLNTSVAPSGVNGGLLFPYNTSNGGGTRTVAFIKTSGDDSIDFAFDGSYVGDVITTDEYDIDAFNKFAISIIEGAVNVYSNGSSAYSASRSINKTLNKVFIGAWQGGTSPLNASMKKLIYFPRKLDNNELIKLTQ